MDTSLDSLLMPDAIDLDFDVSTLFQSVATPTTNSRCNFKECIQTRITDPYFCTYHSIMIHETCNKPIEQPAIEQPPIKKQKTSNWCGVSKCRKEQTEDSYLCDYHFLSLDNEKIKLAFVCREKGCTQVKQLKQKKCTIHL